MSGVPANRRVRALFGPFALKAAITSAVLVGAGLVPTRRLAGESAVKGMVAGCVVSLVGSWVGGAVVVRSLGRWSTASMWTVMVLGMSARLAALFVLGFAALRSGWFERTPMLVWIATSYVVLLIVDTAFLVRVGRIMTDGSSTRVASEGT